LFLKKYKASGLFGLGPAAFRLLSHMGNSPALESSGIYCRLWIIIVYVGSRSFCLLLNMGMKPGR
jgi:hypothetical protein